MERNIKTVLYHHRIASKDGQFVHVEEIITAMQNKGIVVHLVAPSLSEKSEFGHDGGWVAKLKKHLPKFIYELLELSYSGWLFIKLLRAVLKHKPDAIYERYNLYQPAGILVSKLTNTPIFLEVNAPLYEERARYSGGIALPWLAKKIERFTWRNADRVFPVTSVLSSIIEKDIGKSRHLHVVHNGVKTDVAKNTPAPTYQEGQEITIGFVGFMHLTCGVENVISLMAEKKNLPVKLVCIGDGPRAEALMKMAVELGVQDKVDFKGLVDRETIFSEIKKFDIALQPAVTAYASPLKMFEYMAAGCLIIAPDQPNIHEILDKKSALFFNPGDTDSFKKTLEDAIQKYDQHQEKRTEAQKVIIEKRFTWENNVERILSPSIKG